jgi:hypothetical protein
MQKNSTINDLIKELSTAKERLNFLEYERKNLQNENHSINSHTTSIIKSLENELEALKNERDLKIQDYESKLKLNINLNKEEIEKVKTDLAIEKQSLINTYESKLVTEKALYEEKLLTVERVK